MWELTIILYDVQFLHTPTAFIYVTTHLVQDKYEGRVGVFISVRA